MTLEDFRKAIERMPDLLARDNSTYRIALRFGMVMTGPRPVIFYFEELGIKIGKEDAV